MSISKNPLLVNKTQADVCPTCEERKDKNQSAIVNVLQALCGTPDQGQTYSVAASTMSKEQCTQLMTEYSKKMIKEKSGTAIQLKDLVAGCD